MGYQKPAMLVEGMAIFMTVSGICGVYGVRNSIKEDFSRDALGFQRPLPAALHIRVGGWSLFSMGWPQLPGSKKIREVKGCWRGFWELS